MCSVEENYHRPNDFASNNRVNALLLSRVGILVLLVAGNEQNEHVIFIRYAMHVVFRWIRIRASAATKCAIAMTK